MEEKIGFLNDLLNTESLNCYLILNKLKNTYREIRKGNSLICLIETEGTCNNVV